jgi:uncharacterized protein YoxC
MWIIYFLVLVFVVGFVILNVYTAELIHSVESLIKEKL